MSTEKITVKAEIGAAPQKVWEYYTAPQHITQWNTPAPTWHCPSAENDLRVGGTFNSRMEAKDGSFGFDFGGVYTAMEPGKSFTYRLGDGREASVDFAENGGKTAVTVVFDPENQNPVDFQRDGWQAILNNFKDYTEKN